ncbi:hypothetical protein [Streptomyces indicus]|uniref:ABC-2 family transporter protein n=1 Tax=Streptomyces indicus TaxID=417292 RepID=A0A1G9HCI3_9ACTN|nr:hypothetical protein [Streptomyces indicus]SDL10619.1 hypothetical protein SAMN05421806_118119 [Streptomyces indicus]
MSTMSFAPRGLTWAVLRLHRVALLLGGLFLTLMVGSLLWVRSRGIEAGSLDSGCAIPAQPGLRDCREPAPSVLLDWTGEASTLATVIAWMSYGIAAYAAGALIARELENGTAALAWTQSVSPARWLASKLLVPAILLTVGGTALVLLYRWMWQDAPPGLRNSWSYPDTYVDRGPVAVAYLLCALAVGALTAVAVRRVLPAMGIAMVAMLLVLEGLHRMRDQLWPTDSTSMTLRGWWSAGGIDDHPAKHFWPLQLMETGIVLALTAALTATAFWLLRRRTP